MTQHCYIYSMCEVMADPHTSRMFDSQTMQASTVPKCKSNELLQTKADNADVNEINSNTPSYLRSSTNRAADKKVSQVLMNKIHNEFSTVLSGTGCFEGTFSLKIKDDSQQNQSPTEKGDVHAQGTHEEELERLQENKIIMLLGMVETLEWFNSFVLVPEANDMV